MNLLKIQDKLKGREYRTIEEVLDHIQLVWDNCKAYNPEGPFYILADKMERAFKKMIRNYLPNIQVIVPSNIQFMQSQQPQILMLIRKLKWPQVHIMEQGLNQNKIIGHLFHYRIHLPLPTQFTMSQHLLISKGKIYLKFNRFLNHRKIVSIKGYVN